MVYDEDYFKKRYQSEGIISIGDIGTTVAPHVEAPLGTEEQLRSGSKIIEINIGGRGGSNQPTSVVNRGRGGPIPAGAYGKTQRQELKELGIINEAEFRLHGDSNANFLGFQGGEGGGGLSFNPEAWTRTMEEFKENIDFGYDIGSKGLTFHIIGATRPVTDAKGITDKFEDKGEQTYTFFDKDNGKAIARMNGNQRMFLPQLFREEIDDKKIWTVKQHDIDGVKFLKPDGADRQDLEVTEWIDYFSKMKKEKPEEFKKYETLGDTPQKIIAGHYLKYQGFSAESEYHNYLDRGKETAKNFDNYKLAYELKKNPNYAINFQKENPEKWVDHREWLVEKRTVGDPREGVPKLKIDEMSLDKLKERLESSRRTMLSHITRAGLQSKQLANTQDVIDNGRLQSFEEYGLEKNVQGISEIAKYTYDKSKKLGAPLVEITPENIFPNHYGSHPDELKEVIDKGREAFKKKLIEEDSMSEALAEDEAKRVIGANFDLGHANLWRYYWKGDDEGFNKWLIEESANLAKEGYIKEVQVNDSFGYADDSLPLGEGNAPAEAVHEIRKHLPNVPIISEGYGNPSNAKHLQTLRTWQTLNPQLYSHSFGSRTGQSKFWDDRAYHEANRNRSYAPNFLVGPAAPSEDFKLWTEIPLE